ncbi:ATP-dependent protease ATPase subunit HslU [Candidatus Desantisbacteria bacterium]|nr:ATP-dependent protease ATPase subunit HslU [Candidatus Desantisbacteria bacterium]
MEILTPKQIVEELDKYIVGQNRAKKAVAIALRSRWRRQQLDPDLKDEVTPKNIIMIGSTGIGKTEIARRLAKLAQAPFIKVEASKFTEVGYVGRDVESMIRDLTELAVKMVREEKTEHVKEQAGKLAEERILDLLLPETRKKRPRKVQKNGNIKDENIAEVENNNEAQKEENKEIDFLETREKLRNLFREGKLNNREMRTAMIEIFSSSGLEEMGVNFQDMLGNAFPPKKTKKKKMLMNEAYEYFVEEESQRLVDMDKVIEQAIKRVEESGIVFIDEIDKIAGREGKSGPDVSREGVQRDLLPIIESSTIPTKYGMVKTDHILFIAAGAFNVSKPSDLIPELQGRFPIRVRLDRLNKDDFVRILKEPKNALIKQYTALLKAEEVDLVFKNESLDKIASLAMEINQRTEDIGARRLYSIMEKILADISFEAPERKGEKIIIDKAYIEKNVKIEDILKDDELKEKRSLGFINPPLAEKVV